MATIAVDFDGVIHDYKHIPDGHKMGPPIAGAKAALTAMKGAGHNVVILTARGDHPYIHDWLKFYGIPVSRVTNVKAPDMAVFIDDKALRFNGDWIATMKQMGFK